MQIFDGSLDALLLARDSGVHDFAEIGKPGAALFREFLNLGRMRGQFPFRRPDGERRVLRDVTDQIAVHHGILDAGIEFLQKPILPHALLKKVRHVLDGPSRLAS